MVAEYLAEYLGLLLCGICEGKKLSLNFLTCFLFEFLFKNRWTLESSWRSLNWSSRARRTQTIGALRRARIELPPWSWPRPAASGAQAT